MDQATEKLASPDTVLARVQDVFRAELDNDDLVIGLDTRQKDLKAWTAWRISGWSAASNSMFSSVSTRLNRLQRCASSSS
jgi:hypothetical protein